MLLSRRCPQNAVYILFDNAVFFQFLFRFAVLCGQPFPFCVQLFILGFEGVQVGELCDPGLFERLCRRLIQDQLKELTYPEETGADPVSFEKRREKSKAEKISSHTVIEEEIHFVEERAVPFQRERVSPFKEGAYPDRETEPWIPKEVPQTDSGQTNTEITTKTTAESTQKNTTEIGNGYRDNPILSYQAAEEQFKDQIDYDAIWIDRPFDRKLLNEIVGLAVDVLTSNAKTIRVNQEERPLGIVQGMYKKLDKFTVEYVIDSIKQCTRKANNIRAVLLTALYNATLTANSYISNLFAYQEAIPQT